MSKTKILFHVKVADPARTFYDMASGLYVAQDNIEPVFIETPAVKLALQRGGLIKVNPTEKAELPPENETLTTPTTPETPDTNLDSETSRQESSEEGSDESEDAGEGSDTPEDEQTTGNEDGEEEEEGAGGEETTGGQDDDDDDEPKSLKDLVKSKTLGKQAPKAHKR